MKKVTNVFLCVCLSLMLSILSLHMCWALDISAYAGQSNVSVGSTISVTFRASDDAMRWIYTISYSGNLTSSLVVRVFLDRMRMEIVELIH